MRSITPHQHAILRAAAQSTGRLRITGAYTPRIWLTMMHRLAERKLIARVGPACFITVQGRDALANAPVKPHNN